MKNKTKSVMFLIALVLIAVFIFTDFKTTNETPNNTIDTSEKTNLTFKDSKTLEDHYNKHGKDMGFENIEEYLKGANALINNPKALHKLEKEDGDNVYYLEETNEIAFVSKEGIIRTYFCPDNGKTYFDKQ